MSLTTNSTVSSQIDWSQIETQNEKVRIFDAGIAGKNVTFTQGTGVHNINKVWHATGGLGNNEGVTFDLTNLSLDVLGGSGSVNFDSGFIKAIVVSNTSSGVANNSRLLLSAGTGSNSLVPPFEQKATRIPIYASGTYSAINREDGWGVSSTAKNISIYNSGAGSSQTYEIAIIGRV